MVKKRKKHKFLWYGLCTSIPPFWLNDRFSLSCLGRGPRSDFRRTMDMAFGCWWHC